MKARIILASCAVLGFFIQQFVLTQLGSDYAILDNIASLVGIASSILSLLGYIEYIYLQILGTVLTIVMALICNAFRRMDPMDMVWGAVKCLGWELVLVAVACLAINITVFAKFDRTGYRRDIQ